jgi:glycine/D-amino acid oxidase-like deaminating enzyme
VQDENHEIWFEGANIVNYPKTILTKEEVDVLIVGGGITGITSAYLLSKTDKKVTLLEKNKICEYVTSRTTGFLTQVIDIDSNKLINLTVIENAKLVMESHRKAIDEIENIIRTEKIECDFS